MASLELATINKASRNLGRWLLGFEKIIFVVTTTRETGRIIGKSDGWCLFKEIGSISMLQSRFSSVQFSHSVMFNSVRPHGLQHSRPPCPSPTLEFTQTHGHWVGDAIQPSHPLSPSPVVFNLSQHQGLFKWVSSSHEVAKVLEFQLQHQSFQWMFRTDFL